MDLGLLILYLAICLISFVGSFSKAVVTRGSRLHYFVLCVLMNSQVSPLTCLNITWRKSTSFRDKQLKPNFNSLPWGKSLGGELFYLF